VTELPDLSGLVSKEQLDAVYTERNRVVQALTKVFPAHLQAHEGDWDDDWRTVVCVHLPTGQVTWHVNTADAGRFFRHLGYSPSHWDGHDTEEKYRRLENLEPRQAEGAADERQAPSADPGSPSPLGEQSKKWREEPQAAPSARSHDLWDMAVNTWRDGWENGYQYALRPSEVDLEALSSRLHDVYQKEAHRRGDVRHDDDYAALSDDTKEWDRVLARWVLENFAPRFRRDIPPA